MMKSIFAAGALSASISKAMFSGDVADEFMRSVEVGCSAPNGREQIELCLRALVGHFVLSAAERLA